MDATLALSFSMFSGSRNWGQNSNLALKLERSYHRAQSRHMCTKFQVDWTSTSSKTTLTKNFNLKWDKQMNRRTDGQTNRGTDQKT